MNHEIYDHIENLNDLVNAHALTFRKLQTSMGDDIISYAEYIENSGRLSTYFLNAYDRLNAEDEEIPHDDELDDPDYEPNDYCELDDYDE